MPATRSLPLWIVLLLGSGACAMRRQRGDDEEAAAAAAPPAGDGDDESWPESVSRARCASRCLSLHCVAALSTSLQVRDVRSAPLAVRKSARRARSSCL